MRYQCQSECLDGRQRLMITHQRTRIATKTAKMRLVLDIGIPISCWTVNACAGKPNLEVVEHVWNRRIRIDPRALQTVMIFRHRSRNERLGEKQRKILSGATLGTVAEMIEFEIHG